MRTVFHDSAWQELVDAHKWHEAEQEELGREFSGEVYAALKKIARYPLRFPLILPRARRLVLQRFRYVIIYEIKSGYVYIIAIMHTSRSPGYWRSRVTKK